MLEVKSKRIGGATYQVPVEVPQQRKVALAMRWIIGYAKARKGNSMSDRLAAEILAAYNNEGSSLRKKRIRIKWLKQIRLLLILDKKL